MLFTFVWLVTAVIGFWFITEAWVHDFGDMPLYVAILWGIGSFITAPFMVLFGIVMYFSSGAGKARLPSWLKMTVKKQKKD